MADAQLTDEWRARLDALGPGLKVGISWRAGGQPSERRKRTTGLEIWRPVFTLSGVQFVNLQYGETAAEIAAAAQELGAITYDPPDGDPLVDLDAFAAKIAALDLVISVGNATVHLAGALGVPAWAALPKVPGWRWQIAGRESPWYSSVRLFRQRERGDWSPAFAEVAAALGELAGELPSRIDRGYAVNSQTLRQSGVANLTGLTDVGAKGSRPAPPVCSIDADVVFSTAAECAARGDLAAAESHCSQILEHFPRYAGALDLLGQIARQNGRHDLAIRTLSRAAAAAETNAAVQLNLASAQHDAGQLLPAIESYCRAIALDSGLIEAHFGLAKALRAAGRSADAIAPLESTIALNPDHHKALNLLGGCYLEADRWSDAERAFRVPLDFSPTIWRRTTIWASRSSGRAGWPKRSPATTAPSKSTNTVCKPSAIWPTRSIASANRPRRRWCAAKRQDFARLDSDDKGSGVFSGQRRSLPNRPLAQKGLPTPSRPGHLLTYSPTHAASPMIPIDDQVKLTAVRLNAGDVAAAEQIGRKLIAAAPQNINVLRLMGAIARKQGQLEESLDYFRRAVALNDRMGLLHFELGTAYTELQRSEEAYQCYLNAVQFDPSLQAAYVNLSAIMEQHERYQEAIEWAEKAIALKTDCGLSYYNLANAERELGQLDAAIESYSKALQLKPDRAKTLWNLGICHLLAGNFGEGWPLFEQRQNAQEVFFDRYTQPQWDGSSLAGKTIVVHAEQGIGDEILFASCFPDLLPLAKRCIFVCDPRLEKLFARSFPQAGVYGHLRRKDWSPPAILEPFDVQIPAGSLPLYFRSSPESFPRRERFLKIDPALLAMWRSRLAALGPGLKIGISWRAGGKPAESRKRTIPLDQWASIFAVPGTQFINLQYGDATAEIAAVKSQFGVEIHDWEEGDPLVDVDSFAAKIAALDVVISVGNATVHIAGAVGTPAWTLLPMVPSWRWMIAGDQSPWYGRVRLFRQQAGGDWQPVLARIESMVANRLKTDDAVTTTKVMDERHDSKTPSSNPAKTQRWFGPAELAGHKTDQLVAKALEEAKAAEQSGDLERAERKYREALQLAPRHFEALNGLGVVARKTGRTELAIRSFQRSLAMIDALPIQQFNLADALADVGRFEEALVHYRRGIKLDPTNAVAHLQAGRMLNRLGRPNESLASFEQALQLTPANDAALVERARTLKALCRIDEAIEQLESAVQIRPDSAALVSALGAMYLDEQRFAEAAEQFRRATALDPIRAAAFIDLARALESLGRLDEAVSSLERAVALDSTGFTAIMRLAMLRARLGELESAAELLRRAVELRPADAGVLNMLGVVLGRLGSTDNALDCLDDAVQFAPDFAEAHLNRAYALLRAGRFVEGWVEFEWRRYREVRKTAPEKSRFSARIACPTPFGTAVRWPRKRS